MMTIELDETLKWYEAVRDSIKSLRQRIYLYKRTRSHVEVDENRWIHWWSEDGITDVRNKEYNITKCINAQPRDRTITRYVQRIAPLWNATQKIDSRPVFVGDHSREFKSYFVALDKLDQDIRMICGWLHLTFSLIKLCNWLTSLELANLTRKNITEICKMVFMLIEHVNEHALNSYGEPSSVASPAHSPIDDGNESLLYKIYTNLVDLYSRLVRLSNAGYTNEWERGLDFEESKLRLTEIERLINDMENARKSTPLVKGQYSDSLTPGAGGGGGGAAAEVERREKIAAEVRQSSPAPKEGVGESDTHEAEAGLVKREGASAENSAAKRTVHEPGDRKGWFARLFRVRKPREKKAGRIDEDSKRSGPKSSK